MTGPARAAMRARWCSAATTRVWASPAASDDAASRCASSTTSSRSRACRDTSGDAIRVPDLRTEQALLDALALARGKLGLAGWVLYPTREENVAGIAAQPRRAPAGVPGARPRAETRSAAWDKREVYRLAERLSIPTPRTWFPQSEADLAAIEVDDPVVVKPAIKEHFFYATQAKAWRANTAAELLTAYRRADAIMPAGEVIVQELIPGGGSSSTPTARSSARAARSRA